MLPKSCIKPNGCIIGTWSQSSSLSSAQTRQQPQSVQPESPEPQPQGLLGIYKTLQKNNFFVYTYIQARDGSDVRFCTSGDADADF